MGKTEEDWKGLKLGFLKTVQPNNFSKLIPAACNFKNNAQETFVCLGSLILSFTCNFFAYFKFHSDWGRVIGKIKQNELDCRDTAPLRSLISISNVKCAPCGDKKWQILRISTNVKMVVVSRALRSFTSKIYFQEGGWKEQQPLGLDCKNPLFFCWSRMQAVAKKAWSKGKKGEQDRRWRNARLPWKPILW